MKLVATIFPPIDLFEDVADPNDFDALLALRARTDPFVSDRIGPAIQIPRDERAYGPGAGYIMAPFAYPSPDGTRFGPRSVRHRLGSTTRRGMKQPRLQK